MWELTMFIVLGLLIPFHPTRLYIGGVNASCEETLTPLV